MNDQVTPIITGPRNGEQASFPEFLQILLPLTPTIIRSSTEVAEEGLVVVVAAQITPDPVG